LARHAGIVVSALVLALGTMLLIPLSDALKSKPDDRLEFQTVTTTTWHPPPPPPPRTLPKPPPPKEPEKPAEVQDKPQITPQPTPPPPPATRLPLRLDFEKPRFEADFALGFTVDPTATEIPEVAEAGPAESPPPPPPPAKASYESNELDRHPVPVSQPRPVFPYYARQRGIEGYVDLRFLVNAQGTVETAEVLAAQPAGVFDNEALRAIRRWRFQPGIRHGQPVAANMQIRIRFTLDQ
jgi:protein TonB